MLNGCYFKEVIIMLVENVGLGVLINQPLMVTAYTQGRDAAAH